jgi:transcriptional regulator with XRE-family HTH domain
MARSKADRTPHAVAIGARIATAREQKGYSQELLASKVGKTKGAVGQWEIGATTPRPALFPEIAAALGVEMRWLMRGDEPDADVKAVTVTEKNILDLARGLTPDEQARALAMLKAAFAPMTKK